MLVAIVRFLVVRPWVSIEAKLPALHILCTMPATDDWCSGSLRERVAEYPYTEVTVGLFESLRIFASITARLRLRDGKVGTSKRRCVMDSSRSGRLICFARSLGFSGLSAGVRVLMSGNTTTNGPRAVRAGLARFGIFNSAAIE